MTTGEICIFVALLFNGFLLWYHADQTAEATKKSLLSLRNDVVKLCKEVRRIADVLEKIWNEHENKKIN